jgi:hypothetical protein
MGTAVGNITVTIITIQIAMNRGASIPAIIPIDCLSEIVDCQIRIAHETAAKKG